MLVICLLNNIVLRGRGFCTSSIAQITGNVPRLLADIVHPVSQRLLGMLLFSCIILTYEISRITKPYSECGQVVIFSTIRLGGRKLRPRQSHMNDFKCCTN